MKRLKLNERNPQMRFYEDPFIISTAKVKISTFSQNKGAIPQTDLAVQSRVNR